MYKYSLFLCLLCFCAPRLDEIAFYGHEHKNIRMRIGDAEFIEYCKKNYPSIDSASNKMAEFGWQYMRLGNFNYAMRRFNECWLLDSLNPRAYWGIALIVGTRDQKFKYAKELLRKAVSLDTNNCELWFDYAASNLNVIKFAKDTNQYYRIEAINSFNKCINLKCDEERIKQSKELIEELNKKN
jgi:hypothetical protein